jgi:hypothetical protein
MDSWPANYRVFKTGFECGEGEFEGILRMRGTISGEKKKLVGL